MLSALIFDVDGTLADTESAHLAAFNAAFSELGMDWQWSREKYTELLSVAGGKERIRHFWMTVDPKSASRADADGRIRNIHASKTRHYEDIVNGGKLPLRPGVLRLIKAAFDEQLPVAIATTTTPDNIDALLRTPLGADWRRYFSAIRDGGTTPVKKPAPDVYLDVLKALDLPADSCLAFEDSRNGLRAACAAGIQTIVTPTSFTSQHAFDEALLVLPHLGDPDQPLPQLIIGADQHWVDLKALRRWHEGTLFEAA